jgi:hypothetical protein
MENPSESLSVLADTKLVGASKFPKSEKILRLVGGKKLPNTNTTNKNQFRRLVT